jgi:alkane 1-monooxygenase
MTAYEFIPKSIIGGFKSAFKINPTFTSISVIGSVLFLAIIQRYYGWFGLGYHLTVACGSIFYLELTNYIEHYGLRRKRLPDGTY